MKIKKAARECKYVKEGETEEGGKERQLIMEIKNIRLSK